MQRDAIANLLIEKHQRFITYLQALSDDDFTYAAPGKWSAGQQLDHLVRSLSRVIVAFKQPAFLLKLFFGKPNRPGRNYDEVVARYKVKLAEGGRASKRYIPDAKIYLAHRDVQLADLTRLADELAARVNSMSEESLDTILLPHPLLGKLTMREMMYFTVYHVIHHQEGVERNLQEKSRP